MMSPCWSFSWLSLIFVRSSKSTRTPSAVHSNSARRQPCQSDFAPVRNFRPASCQGDQVQEIDVQGDFISAREFSLHP